MKMIQYVMLSSVLIIIFSFWYLCPLFNNLPHPTGPYCVGYIHLDWRDQQASQDINVEIFYPSVRPKKEETQFPYQPQKMRSLSRIKAENSILPLWVWHCLLNNIFSYAEPNAPIIHEDTHAFPVILYLPGIGGEDLHNVCCENLASHGYVVCAIIPAGDVAVTVKDDGTIMRLN